MPPESIVPRDELEWLSARGELRTFEAGTVQRDPATPIDEMTNVLAGRVGLYVE